MSERESKILVKSQIEKIKRKQRLSHIIANTGLITFAKVLVRKTFFFYILITFLIVHFIVKIFLTQIYFLYNKNLKKERLKLVMSTKPPFEIMIPSCEFTKSYFVVKKAGVKRFKIRDVCVGNFQTLMIFN